MPSRKSLKVFRPGRHTSASGQTLSFTDAELAATARAYDPALHEAPLVVGHPTHDKPAYGWVQAVQFAEGHLETVPHQVDESFAELVGKGRFKKISASFYTPDSPQNPVPGVYYLRHVGFLGAAPPAIKGLPNASFAADETGVVYFADCLDLGEVDGLSVATLFRRLRDWLIGRDGLEAADLALPDYAIRSLELEASRDLPGPAYQEAPPAPPPPPAPPAPPAPPEETSTLPTTEELEAQAAELERQRTDLATREAALASKEHASFLEGLITEGKLLPAHKDGVLSFMASLSTSGDVVEFSEDGKPAKGSQLGFFKKLLAAQPKVVEFGESAPPEQDPPAGTVSFSAPAGYGVDPDQGELYTKAKAYQAAHPGTDIVTAYKAVGGK